MRRLWLYRRKWSLSSFTPRSPSLGPAVLSVAIKEIAACSLTSS